MMGTTGNSPFLDEDMKVVLTSCLLLFIPVSVLSFNAFDPSDRYYFPFLEWGLKYSYMAFHNDDPVSESLQLVVSLGSDRVCAIIYITCGIINPDFKRVLTVNLWAFYLLFEAFRLVDLFLTYEQFPFRIYYAYFLIIFQMAYAILFIIRKK